MPILCPGTNPAPGLSWSALDFIKAAMRSLGILASGEAPSAEEAKDALAVLNQMVDQWQAQRLMIFTIAINTLVPLTLKQTYTLGSDASADFNLTRPVNIETYTVINLNNATQPLELELEPLTDREWADIPVKNISAALPRKVYDDGAFPLRSLSFWPIPNVQVNFKIYSWSPLNQFMDLVTAYTFPSAYYSAIVTNLAVYMAGAGFGGNLNQVTTGLAQQGLAIIKTMNAPIIDSKCDPAVTVSGDRRIYNWLTDNAGKS